MPKSIISTLTGVSGFLQVPSRRFFNSPHGHRLFNGAGVGAIILLSALPLLLALVPTLTLPGVSSGGSQTVTVTPAAGYYFSAQPTCSSNFSASVTTGLNATSAQTVSVKYNGTTQGGTGTCTFTVSTPLSFPSATYMQDVTSAQCSGLTTNQQYKIKDKRDNKDYTVAKLGDGKCWMTKNLNLAGGTKVTSSDSHVTEDYTLPPSDTEGFSDNDTAYVYNASDDISKCNSKGCGGYYSWRAATANTGTTSVTSGNASGDICPKDWHLPTQSEFSAITSYRADFNPVLAGRYSSGSLGDAGSVGTYWSSTALNDTRACYLLVDNSSMDTYYYNKGDGRSVRCVFGS